MNRDPAWVRRWGIFLLAVIYGLMSAYDGVSAVITGEGPYAFGRGHLTGWEAKNAGWQNITIAVFIFVGLYFFWKNTQDD